MTKHASGFPTTPTFTFSVSKLFYLRHRRTLIFSQYVCKVSVLLIQSAEESLTLQQRSLCAWKLLWIYTQEQNKHFYTDPLWARPQTQGKARGQGTKYNSKQPKTARIPKGQYLYSYYISCVILKLHWSVKDEMFQRSVQQTTPHLAPNPRQTSSTSELPEQNWLQTSLNCFFPLLVKHN